MRTETLTNWQWAAYHCYERQAAKIRLIEANGETASDEEYAILFQFEDAMKVE